MDVHDIGPDITEIVPVGSVFTIEPGLYFGTGAPEEFAGIGIRIEDNIHKDSPTTIENLTEQLSKSLA